MVFIVLIFSVISFLFSYVFMSVVVDGASMYPTLRSGDVLMVHKTQSIKRGDIVVIKDGKDSNGNDKLIIKRVIATELDSVEIIDGVVKVNGMVLQEDYIIEGYSDSEDDLEFLVVPRGKFFYLGDNRLDSLDSRVKGTCIQSQIVGVVEEWTIPFKGINKFFYDIGSFLRSEN